MLVTILYLFNDCTSLMLGFNKTSKRSRRIVIAVQKHACIWFADDYEIWYRLSSPAIEYSTLNCRLRCGTISSNLGKSFSSLSLTTERLLHYRALLLKMQLALYNFNLICRQDKIATKWNLRNPFRDSWLK